MTEITFNVGENEKKFLMRLSEKHNASIDELIREAIQEYWAEEYYSFFKRVADTPQMETQNSNKNSNVISVYDGVSEAVRCAMCSNPNKSDRGCDGACLYDEKLYERIMKAIAESVVDTPQTECPVAIVFGCDECHRPKCDYKNCRRCKWFVTDKCHECFSNELFEDSGYVTQTERSE